MCGQDPAALGLHPGGVQDQRGGAGLQRQVQADGLRAASSRLDARRKAQAYTSEEDEINVPMTLGVFRDKLTPLLVGVVS